MRIRRGPIVVGLTLLSLVLASGWPVRATDFRSFRQDSVILRNLSMSQQSSNQAFNMFDIFSDPGAPSYGLYWKGALRGDTTFPRKDNLESDPELNWDTWVTALGKNPALLSRPLFTPNIPQAWSPIVIDWDRTGNAPDHFLVNVSFEPVPNLTTPDLREQVITAYWPETSSGLGNLNGRQNRLPPHEDLINGLVWRVKTRDLDPIRTHSRFANSVGVVTQPPIYTVVNGFHLLYMVIGTGENNDPAQVICLRIPPPPGTQAPPVVPDPVKWPQLYDAANNPDGGVMWAYEVKDRNNNNPIPVAGISFADVGDTQLPLPLLFITTQDGQLLCLNAKPQDGAPVAVDGDPRAGEVRWKYTTPAGTTPAMGFSYGMAPAAALVPLTGSYSATTVSNALVQHTVDEWMVFVADTWGAFRAFDARGDAGGPRLRWQDAVWQVDPMGVVTQLQRQSLISGVPERFCTPPVVYQGGTPMTTTTGAPLSPYDNGYDDEVLFASERGRIYSFRAMGRLKVNPGMNDDGEPLFENVNTPHLESGTVLRWLWPDDDNYTPSSPTPIPVPVPLGAQEPMVWPRELVQISPVLMGADGRLGPQIPIDGNFYMRAPLATSLGGNANPNNGSPNLDLGDDVVIVPHLQDQTANEQTFLGSAFDATKRYFYEYAGTLKPYPFVQAERAVSTLLSARITWTDPVTLAVTTVTVGNDPAVLPAEQVPMDRVFRLGTIKSNAPTITQVPGAPGFNAQITVLQDDTAYMVDQTFFYPPLGREVTVPISLAAGTKVELRYIATDGNTYTDPQADLPSCYFQDDMILPPPGSPSTVGYSRGRASLTVNRARLEGRLRSSGTVLDERPAQVDLVSFDAYDERPGAPYAVGGSSGTGAVFTPSWFRGRIVVLSNQMATVAVLPGLHDTKYGLGLTFGPILDGDPGSFAVGPAPLLHVPPGRAIGIDYDIPEYPDVSSSLTVVDGWLYLTYANGHTRAWSNQAGGAPGTNGLNTPIFTQPPPPNYGNRVRAPVAIRILDDVPVGTTPTLQDIIAGTYPYRDVARGLDGSLMIEYGETLHFFVDFGTFTDPELYDNTPADRNPNESDANGGRFLDTRLLNPQNRLQASILSSIGAVGQPAAATQGVAIIRDQASGRTGAILTVNCGIPSPTNPLSPGTPMLAEKASAQFTNNEGLYYVQITMTGLQWLWPNSDPTRGIVGQYPSYDSPNPMLQDPARPDPRRIHYWVLEPNQGAARFAATAGGGVTPNWNWLRPETREYAPLFSYNNPLLVYYDPIPDSLPLPNAAQVHGMVDANGPLNALPLDPSTASRTTPGGIRFRERFTSRNDDGRRNADIYATPSQDGYRSGVGQPIVPTVGVGVIDAGGSTLAARQLLFGEHGRATPAQLDLIPEVARVRIGDRSHLGYVGRPLTVRVQRSPLTKMGCAARYGGVPPAAGIASGSLEQNATIWDDAPNQLYGSIPATRLTVTRQGSSVDLASGPVPVPGRLRAAQPPSLAHLPLVGALAGLQVQVDIPPFTADDVYSTRWRSTTPNGADPTSARMTFNPFFPGTILGEPGRPFFDRSETRMYSDQMPAPPEPDPVSPVDPEQNDRSRRVVLFVDADGDGVLDLDNNRREAYRTFAVQIGVIPEMKVEAQQGFVDLGNVYHGRKQPGTGAGVLGIREFQRMAQLAASGAAADRAVSAYYNSFWRRFALLNRGNVNLAYVKPELIYSLGPAAQIRALPSEGNDWWRALPMVNATTATALVDPLQIFLRTSVDEQFLPDTALAYAGGPRAVWLQKAPVGAAQPGSVVYVDRQIDTRPPATKGLAITRDPSVAGNNWQNNQDLWLTLNIPTGAPLGQYSGTVSFFNDRMVSFVQDITAPAGFRYLNVAATDGLLQRNPATGEPLEPVTDPAMQIKARVVENLAQGRYVYQPATPGNPTGTQVPDRPDRRLAPAISLAPDPATGSTRLMLAYASNRAGIGTGTRPQPFMYDLWGTQLPYDNTRLLFPFDELPDDHAPWSQWTGFATPAGSPFSLFTNMASLLAGTPSAVGAVTNASLAHDAAGNGILAWTERRSRNGMTATSPLEQEHRILYGGVNGTAFGPLVLSPGGQPPDLRVERTGVRFIPTRSTPAQWLAFYATGTGARKGLAFTWTNNPTNALSWTPEHILGTSRSLSTVSAPSVTLSDPMGALPSLAWVAYGGASQRRGLSEILLSRFELTSLLTQGARGAVDPLGSTGTYGQRAFPRVTGAPLIANATRTLYTADGLDWLVNSTNDVKVFLVRPDKATGPGSFASPLALLGVPPNDSPSPSGERVAPLSPALAALPGLRDVRVIADPAAGTIRFTMDTRTLARLAVPTPSFTASSPDPIILVDYTPSTMRLTRGDVSAQDPVVVPVLSDAASGNVYDASWYLQQVDTGKWAAEEPVAGIADRLWIYWRRATAPAPGGPTLYYKVLRPGIRVRAGSIVGVTSSELTVSVRPEEVNPETGQLFFPAALEGQTITVSYRLANGSVVANEQHRVTWQDEAGERPVPLDKAINEGSLDALATFEIVPMTTFGSSSRNPNIRRMNVMWLYWSSTRGTGGDIYSCTLAPRLGPEVAVNGSATGFYPFGARASTARFNSQSARQPTVREVAYRRRRPFVLPAVTQRGPVLVPARGARAAR